MITPNLKIKNFIKDTICKECDVKPAACSSCYVSEILDDVMRLTGGEEIIPTDGCNLCKSKKGKTEDIWYMGKNNNLYNADYCPSCGRKLN